MLIALCFTALLQAPVPPEARSITRRPALPALAAKAPGKPEYGIHLATSQGQFILTNLHFAPANPKGGGVVYRVTGPAGMGPYRLGLQLGGPSKFTQPGLYQGSFFDITKALEGGAAKAAGLDEDWSILGVDGQDFGWNIYALISYLSTHPSVEVLALKRKGWQTGHKQKTFQIQLRMLDTPTDPADGVLVPETVEALQPHLKDPKVWSELVALRASMPGFTPLPVDLAGKSMWVVRGLLDPKQGEQAGRVLEFWEEDPASGPKQNHPETLWLEPRDGLRPGRVLQVKQNWHRIQEVAVDPRSGGLFKFVLMPWAADLPDLLVGGRPSQDLGPGAMVGDQEGLEQLANEALVEWKTRALPGVLAAQDLRATEDLVVRIEKGLLKLDLDVKGIHSRLDARARSETERKAQAELAAKDGKPSPQPLPPPEESERLAHLRDQRKTILMAILGSAKQSLANMRR